jgi:hypothetical protein
VAASAGIDYSKVNRYRVEKVSQAGTAATATLMIAKVAGTTGTLLRFSAGSIAKAVGDSTVTVDLKKNGTTCLSAVVTLSSSSSNYGSQDGTITVSSLAVDDVLTVVITATVGTGTLPTGLYAVAEFSETAQ